MKYTIHFLTFLLLIFGFASQVGALNWNETSGEKNCGGGTLDNLNGQKKIPQTIATSTSTGGTVVCDTHGYYNGKWYPSPSTWFDIGTDATGNHFSCPDKSDGSGNQGYASQFLYNGTNTKYRVYCKYLDDTPPVVGDITGYGPTIIDRLAVNDQNFYLDLGTNNGSPITLIQGYFEQDQANDVYDLESSNTDANPLNTARLETTWDMSRVDNDGTVDNGVRQYRFYLSYLEDAAGNKTGVKNSGASNLQSYDYNVYANTLLAFSQKSVSSEQLSSNSNIADGSVKNITVRLRDIHGNKIIPVPSISRTVDFNITANNNLRRDQYLNTGSDSALYIGTTTNAFGVSSSALKSLTTQSSTSGDYTLPFYVFAPTNHNGSLVPGSASISSITTDINGNPGATSGVTIGNSNITIKAKPLYTTLFAGDIADEGFIEGVTQNSTIGVSKANTTSISSPSLRMEFGSVSGTNNIANPRYGISFNGGGSQIAEGKQAAWSSTSQLTASLSNQNVDSYMLQDGPVDAESHSYLASIIKYVVGGKTIIYPGDITGKTAYHGAIEGDNSYQTGIKVVGNTTSQNTEEILNNQFDTDVRIIGEFTKSNFKKDIEQKVYKTIRYLLPKASGSQTLITTRLNNATWNDSGLQAEAILGNTVLYFGNMGNANIILNKASDIEGNKTLIVEGGNIYITQDILDPDGDGVLGLIALEKNGQGGNIYINPSVTDIHAIIYSNRSIISYDGTQELDGTNATATDLANQLYIYGSLFSENTLGASRKTTPECPYYVNTSCSTQEAQKYDLNYLRRYFTYDSGSGYDVDIDGDGIFDKNKSGSLSNGAINNYKLRVYPVIVDYNPQVQQTPPPFFD